MLCSISSYSLVEANFYLTKKANQAYKSVMYGREENVHDGMGCCSYLCKSALFRQPLPLRRRSRWR